MADHFICTTCGTQFAETSGPPASCPICEDDRQYVNPNGQSWTTLADLRDGRRRNVFTEIGPGLTTIQTEPSFAIGQRAHLIQTPAGNVLWDCIALIDDETVERINALGGLAAIAISHPHFYTTIVEWSRAFNAPVHIHADNQPWIMRPDDTAIQLWPGEIYEPLLGVTLIRCGGHFPGSTALHWGDANGGQGALFTGDTIYVVADNRWVTFMYSYPNTIPLDPASVQHIADSVAPYRFERLYAAFGRPVTTDANGAVQRSAERYIAHVRGNRY
jgi:glyoxylase-like metal-dependent hydrolase (beta-lactamase superfamily II)